MSGDPEQEYFADGMVEDIITALSRFKSLFVIARNSSFAYKSKAVDLKQVGRELGVRYVLEGSVRKAGGRLRITGQLIEAASGTHLWADKFDGATEDVFDLQDQVTQRVVVAIAPAVHRAEMQRASERQTSNITAYDLLLKSYPLTRGLERDGLLESIRLLKKAVALDPSYAVAFAKIAGLYARLAQAGHLTGDQAAGRDALTCAQRALDLDETDAEVLYEAAYAIVVFDRDVARHQSLLARAVEINPNSAWAWRLKAWGHVWAGEHAMAVSNFDRSLRIDPVDSFRWNTFQGLATANLLDGQFDVALQWSERAYSEGPRANAIAILRIRGSAAAFVGQMTLARQMAQEVLAVAPDFTIAGWERMIKSSFPYRRIEDVDLLRKGLRKAGLPE